MSRIKAGHRYNLSITKKIIYLAAIVVIFIAVMYSLSQKDNVTLLINQDGFSPQNVNINSGTKVIFKNTDTLPHWPASDFHPTHEIYPEFDPQKEILPGESWTFIPRKIGEFIYHDHLFPHRKGKIIVSGISPSSMQNSSPLSPTQAPLFSTEEKEEFLALSEKEQYAYLESMIEKNGHQSTWNFIVDTFSGVQSQKSHSMAHFLGHEIFADLGFSGLSTCKANFAFGCYHGFSEGAFNKDRQALLKLEKSCQHIGPANSGPWSSCIHGIGHGVAGIYDTSDLLSSLKECDKLDKGKIFCSDGVFMEFANNAPPKFYSQTKSNSLYPCNIVSSNYRESCSRNQPAVMRRILNFNESQIAAACRKATDPTIRFFCLDSIGLTIGQQSFGDPQKIISGCQIIREEEYFAQCLGAASGEIVFQNFPDWEKNAFVACEILKGSYKNDCRKRVEGVISNYKN